jgi:hypothetical protein
VRSEDDVALIGTIAINMRVNSNQFKKGLVESTIALESLRSNLNSVGAEMIRWGSIVAGVGAIAIWKLTTAAIALGEQTDRARVQFGEFAGDVVKESKLLARAYGTDQREFIQFASAFSAVFEGAGFQGEAVAKLSTHFTRLGLDLASLTHIPVEEALGKIQSGLAGQVRPLREVGVFMSEEGVAAYAAAHGIGALGKELNESEKIQARAGFITEHLQKAVGNLALTADSGGNAIRGLAGRFENLKESIGTALLSVVVPALSEMQVGIEATRIAWENSSIAAENSAVGVVGAVQGQTQAIGYLQMAIGKIADIFQAVGLAFQALQSYFTEGWAIQIGLIATGIQLIEKALDSLGVTTFGFGKMLKEVSKDLHELSTKQWEDFQKALAKPAASENLNAAFDDARKKIVAARVEAKALETDISQFKPVQQATIGGHEVKFSDAMLAGSSEAANTILRTRGGQGQNKGVDAVAKNTAEANHILRQIEAKIAPPAGLAMGVIGA